MPIRDPEELIGDYTRANLIKIIQSLIEDVFPQDGSGLVGPAGGDLTGFYPDPTIIRNVNLKGHPTIEGSLTVSTQSDDTVLIGPVPNKSIAHANTQPASGLILAYGTGHDTCMYAGDSFSLYDGIHFCDPIHLDAGKIYGYTGGTNYVRIYANEVSTIHTSFEADGTVTIGDASAIGAVTIGPRGSVAGKAHIKLGSGNTYFERKDASTISTPVDIEANGVLLGAGGGGPGSDTTAVHSGDTAGGDLSGTYPNPSVVNDSHSHVSATVTEAGLSLSAVTTNDVSTTKHGFAPTLPNDATKFLDGTGAYTTPGGGSPSGSAGGDLSGTYPNPSVVDDSHRHDVSTVSEAGLDISDVTTRNSSTLQHGFLKKLTNVATEFMNGQGNWATPTTVPSGSAGGDLTGTYPNPTLATAGPGATGPIGSATVVPIVTIDAKGRVTALSSTTITGSAPGGSAGGDLTGTYPNPTIATFTNDITAADGVDFAVGTSTGTKIGTSTSQKLALFGKTPIVQPGNITISNYSSAARSFDRSSFTMNQLADIVCELYTGMKNLGAVA